MIQVWTDVCHQIFGGWEKKTIWNSDKNVWCIWEMHVLVKKCLWMFTSLKWKDNLFNENTDTPVKKKFGTQQLLKKLIWDTFKPITKDYLDKDATVNSTSYCQLFRHNSSYLLNNLYIYIYIYIYIYEINKTNHYQVWKIEIQRIIWPLSSMFLWFKCFSYIRWLSSSIIYGFP